MNDNTAKEKSHIELVNEVLKVLQGKSYFFITRILESVEKKAQTDCINQ